MTDKVKKLVLLNLPYLIFVYLFDKLCQGVRLSPGAAASEKLLHIGQGFSAAFASLAPSFHLLDLCVGAAGAVLIRLAVYSKGKNAKKYRRGIEYGSARWGTPADIAPYVDPDFSQNVLLTQTERITMSSRPKEPKYARNKNILVIGGSGSGKTRFFVKPNLLQCHSSYVVTDPKGTILNEVGALLDRKGYRIKSLNLINFKKSMRYNPLAYIRSEKDILPVLFCPHRVHLVRGGAGGAQLHHPAGPHQRQRGAGGRRGVPVPRGPAVRQAGEGAPGPLRREAVPQIQNGRGQNFEVDSDFLRRPPFSL